MPNQKIKNGQLALIIVGVAIIGIAGWFLINRKTKLEPGDGDASKQKPIVELDKLHFKRFEKDKTQVEIHLVFDNPAPIGVRIDSLRYTVFMANERIVESRQMEPVQIEAGKRSNIVLKLSIDNAKHEKAFAKGVSDGDDSTRYKLVADVFTNIPFFKGKSIPYEKVKTLPAFMFPKSEIKKVRIDKVGLNKTQIVLETELINPNSFPVGFAEARYIFAFDGDTLPAGSIDTTVQAPPHGSTPLHIPLEIKTGMAIETAIAKLLKTDKTEFYYRFETKLLAKNPAMEGCVAVTERSGKMSDLEK